MHIICSSPPISRRRYFIALPRTVLGIVVLSLAMADMLEITTLPGEEKPLDMSTDSAKDPEKINGVEVSEKSSINIAAGEVHDIGVTPLRVVLRSSRRLLTTASGYTDEQYRNLKRKADRYLLPLMWLCYGIQQTDKTSIGTQATFGLAKVWYQVYAYPTPCADWESRILGSSVNNTRGSRRYSISRICALNSHPTSSCNDI